MNSRRFRFLDMKRNCKYNHYLSANTKFDLLIHNRKTQKKKELETRKLQREEERKKQGELRVEQASVSPNRPDKKAAGKAKALKNLNKMPAINEEDERIQGRALNNIQLSEPRQKQLNQAVDTLWP